MIKRFSTVTAAIILALSTFFTSAYSSASVGSRALRDYPDSDSSVVTVYNEKDGLPTGEANTVLQTDDGYMWIGSYGGLIRYDGKNFRNYSTEGLLDSSSVRSLFEDSKGRLWIGTNDKGVYCMENNAITHVECTNDGFLCIRDFAQDESGTVYVASTSGLASIEGDKLVPYSDPELKDETVYSIAVDIYGRIWANVNNGRCLIIEDGKVLADYTSEDFNLGITSDIYSVAADVKGNVYLGTYDSFLIKLTLTGENLGDKPDITSEYIETPNITTHNKLNVADNGSLLIGGISGFGIVSLEGEYIGYDDGGVISSLNWACIDYEGNVWLASSSNGVIKITQGCFENYNNEAGLTGVTVNAVTKCNDFYYIATDTGLITCDSEWNKCEDKLTSLLEGVRIRHVISQDDRYVWFATYSDYGAIRYDTETDEITVFNADSGIIGDKVRIIGLLSDGTVAIGTQQGLSIIQNDTVIKTYSGSNGFSATAVLSIMELGDSLYVGTDGDGIYEIKSGGDIVHHNADEGLNDGVILRLYADTETSGCYFVSAGSSLYYYNGNGYKKLDNFEKEAGSIYDFYISDGKLWILQNNGIVAVNREELISGGKPIAKNYGVNHGLTGTLNANTHNYLSPDGSLYMSTRNGISVFHFKDVENATPKGIISSVSVDSETFETPSSITVDKNTKRITVNFSALSFSGTSSFRIGYMLEGFDSTETTIKDNNALISYTNLPGGEYTFKFRIYDPVTGETLSSYSLAIVKDKQLTEYAAFWIVLVIVIIIAVTILFIVILNIKTRRYEKHKRELQAIIDKSLITTAKIIDAKDKYTNGHSLRVAEYSRNIAGKMGMSEEEQQNIYSIALLHDIGKIAIPDKILNKPSRLTDEEYAIIKKHVTDGGTMLEDFSVIPGIQDGAKYHHERFDGKGYCEGKSGNDIPLVGRIICVADSYDAMQSTRCYRAGLTEEKIISELERGAGTQFDPNIVPYMLELIKEGTVPIE